MANLLLALAIVSEVAATLSLRASAGFTKLVPSIVVVVGYGLSFWLMGLVLRTLSVSVVYAVWSGVGTALIAVIGILVLGEPARWNVFAGVVLVIAGVVLLNLNGSAHG
jgi:small multidrug resistance pump